MLMDGPVKPHYTPGAGIVFLEPDDAMLRSVVTDTSKALIRDDFGDDFFVNVAAGQIVDSDSDSDWEVRLCFTRPSCAGITSIVDVAVWPKCLVWLWLALPLVHWSQNDGVEVTSRAPAAAGRKRSTRQHFDSFLPWRTLVIMAFQTASASTGDSLSECRPGCVALVVSQWASRGFSAVVMSFCDVAVVAGPLG